ncbi:MAG: UPF0149 family protein [Rubrivivax sp.]
MQIPDYQPALDAPPLADDELAALDEQLGALPGDAAMNVEMLDGYLTALLLAPTPVHQRPAAQWMPPVWGGGEPFASGKQHKRVIVWVLRHLHAIDRALRDAPEAWEPVFSVAESPDGDEWVDAEDWCIGFLHAVAQEAEGWGALFDDARFSALLVPLALLGGDEAQLSDAERTRLADADERDALSRAVPDAVLALSARPR